MLISYTIQKSSIWCAKTRTFNFINYLSKILVKRERETVEIILNGDKEKKRKHDE